MTTAPTDLNDLYISTLESLREGRTHEALTLARSIVATDDPEFEGRVRILLGELATIRGRLSPAITEYRRAVELLREHGRAGSAARALRGLASTLQVFSSPTEALHVLEEARALIDEIDDPEIRTRAVLETAIREGFSFRSAGDSDRARTACREATHAASELQRMEDTVGGRERRSEGGALDSTAVMLGCYRQLVGMLLVDIPADRRKGIETLELAVTHFRRHNLRYHEARATDTLAKALLEVNPEQAVDQMRRAEQIYRDIRARYLHRRAVAWIEQRSDIERSSGGRPVPRRHARHLDPDATEWHGMILAGERSVRLAETAIAFAELQAPVLITGETGTGKEVAALAIHRSSRRAEGAFLAVNCAELTETLLESELFGHRRGSFTDAKENRRGLFEEANGGTIFLDEIGETSPNFQKKLLRVLQEHEIKPVGSGRPIPIDVRVLCATNRDLESLVADGTFREDLYYRISACRLELLPLRKRPEEITILASRFATQIGHSQGHEGAWITQDAAGLLERLPWTGNVRELRNVLDVTLGRALLETGRPVLTADYVREYVRERPSANSSSENHPLPLISDLERCGFRVPEAVHTALDRRLLDESGRLSDWVTWNGAIEHVKLLMTVAAFAESAGAINGAATRLGIHHSSIERAARTFGLERTGAVTARARLAQSVKSS